VRGGGSSSGDASDTVAASDGGTTGDSADADVSGSSGSTGGDTTGANGNTDATPEENPRTADILELTGDASEGEILFAVECSNNCHLLDGTGATNGGIGKDLTIWLGNNDDTKLVGAILDGRPPYMARYEKLPVRSTGRRHRGLRAHGLRSERIIGLNPRRWGDGTASGCWAACLGFAY
jgi:hypothetical protein